MLYFDKIQLKCLEKNKSYLEENMSYKNELELHNEWYYIQ